MKNTFLSLLLVVAAALSCEAQETKSFKAYNGITFDYELVLPEGYSKSKSYQLAVLFTEVAKP